jgi:hypothetical protein
MKTPLLLSFLVGLGVLLGATDTMAQSPRDAVKGHVDKELDRSKKKDKKKRSNRNRSASSSSRNSQDNGQSSTVSLADDPELTRPGPKLPKRVFPASYLRLDLKFDSAYRGWFPQQYSSADVDVAGYLTWSVAVKGKFFKYLTLHRGSYESNGLSAPRTKNAAIAAQVGKHTPKAAKALAYIGFPFMKTWQPIIRYEARAFNTSATPKIPVCTVDYESSADLMDCPRRMDPLRVISSFETLVAGVLFTPDWDSRSHLATRKGKVPPVYAGLGLMSYSKPYQVTIDGNTLEEFLFDGRFRGAGLALGTKLGGGARRFFARADLQVGLGEVALTEDLTLNEVAPEDWLLGYIQGNLVAGYNLVVFDGPPTIYFRPSLTAGGASFHFVSTSGEDESAPNLNWDFLWSARAALTIAL